MSLLAAVVAIAVGQTQLDPNIVIERMFGEAPLGLLVAPNWHRTKNDLVLDIKRKFEERDVRQGRVAKKMTIEH